MFRNRMSDYLNVPVRTQVGLPSTRLATWPIPQPIQTHEIYQLAMELSRRDFELNRLFNPGFYADGEGI